MLSFYTRTTNLGVHIPDGYLVEKLEETLLYFLGHNKTHGGFYFNIYPTDKEMVISVKRVEILGYDEEERLKFRARRAKFYHPDGINLDKYRFNNIWKLSIPPAIDSTQGKAVGLGRYYEKKSRADTVVLYPLKMEEGYSYQDKYTKCKVVILHKNDIWRAIIFYFFTDEIGSEEVDREIKRSWGFLRFKEEEKKE